MRRRHTREVPYDSAVEAHRIYKNRRTLKDSGARFQFDLICGEQWDYRLGT